MMATLFGEKPMGIAFRYDVVVVVSAACHTLTPHQYTMSCGTCSFASMVIDMKEGSVWDCDTGLVCCWRLVAADMKESLL